MIRSTIKLKHRCTLFMSPIHLRYLQFIPLLKFKSIYYIDLFQEFRYVSYFLRKDTKEKTDKTKVVKFDRTDRANTMKTFMFVFLTIFPCVQNYSVKD